MMYQVPTLGSQEGAFENVRQSYQGDQGQQIKQLITAHVLRRVAMCVLASPHGKRQHLAVSHEKGKVRLHVLSVDVKGRMCLYCFMQFFLYSTENFFITCFLFVLTYHLF